jgi:hypothetical protein
MARVAEERASEVCRDQGQPNSRQHTEGLCSPTVVRQNGWTSVAASMPLRARRIAPHTLQQALGLGDQGIAGLEHGPTDLNGLTEEGF